MYYSPVLCCHHQTGDESHPSAAVEDILLTPDKLRDLDLDAFAEELERQVRTVTLYTCSWSFHAPLVCVYMEIRCAEQTR